MSKLNLVSSLFAPVRASRVADSHHHALLSAERIRLRSMVDAVAFAVYGLAVSDLHHMFRDSDLPLTDVAIGSPRTRSLDARGFWRVDRELPPEMRHTVLTLVAFHDLDSKIQSADGDRTKGIEAFLGQNHGEGWMVPETVRLADYRVGRDSRAKHPQPVASRLGPRFYDWQLVQSVDDSDRECHLHARNILGKRGYAALLDELIGRRVAAGEDYCDLLTQTLDLDDYRRHGPGPSVPNADGRLKAAESPADYTVQSPAEGGQGKLFD